MSEKGVPPTPNSNPEDSLRSPAGIPTDPHPVLNLRFLLPIILLYCGILSIGTFYMSLVNAGDISDIKLRMDAFNIPPLQVSIRKVPVPKVPVHNGVSEKDKTEL